MARRYFLFLWLFTGFFSGGGTWTAGQERAPNIRVDVVLVQLNIAVTDHKGNYISGLRPEDFTVSEDKIPETIATFEEGNEPAITNVTPGSANVTASDSSKPAGDHAMVLGPRPAGANVFILFDTSNYMYRGFVFAQDSIADFIRSLEGGNRVAFYSYSRDLSRNTLLTGDRSQVLRGVRSTVAGDNAALYNCLLMTVKDASQFEGRKVVVVFSNGPDNASSVPPEDVAELAQSTGTIIYMVSTNQAQQEPVSTAVFERMSKATGGKAYFAKSWKDEGRAFSAIREDLEHLYALSYYPQPNPNRGWRAISVKLVGKGMQRYHIRTRDGYRILQQAQMSSGPMSTAQESVRK
jgi:VWFA-related protein